MGGEKGPSPISQVANRLEGEKPVSDFIYCICCRDAIEIILLENVPIWFDHLPKNSALCPYFYWLSRYWYLNWRLNLLISMSMFATPPWKPNRQKQQPQQKSLRKEGEKGLWLISLTSLGNTKKNKEYRKTWSKKLSRQVIHHIKGCR